MSINFIFQCSRIKTKKTYSNLFHSKYCILNSEGKFSVLKYRIAPLIHILKNTLNALTINHPSKVFSFALFLPSVKPHQMDISLSILCREKVKHWRYYFSGSEKLSDGISDVVSAIQFNNKMYIFSKDKYWRLDRWVEDEFLHQFWDKNKFNLNWFLGHFPWINQFLRRILVKPENGGLDVNSRPIYDP